MNAIVNTNSKRFHLSETAELDVFIYDDYS